MLGTAAAPAQAAPLVYIGAVSSGADVLQQQTGTPLSRHAYSFFSKSVPTARMITVKAPGVTWAAVASAQPGSSLHNDIVRWATAIKSRPGPVFLAYHHEPEAKGSLSYGTSDQYIAAYRRVVSIFRAQGVTNVRWTWQMTDWAFAVSTSDRRAAGKWYPGDSYVDVVGADAYNWYTCGSGRWVELSTFVDPMLAFARAHGKKAALPEFGSQADPRRAQWLQNAHRYLAANSDVIVAAYYFNRMDPSPTQHQSCYWPLTTSQEISAVRAMALDTATFSTS